MFVADFRASSAPSEHSYAEYLTIPLRPLTQRQSISCHKPNDENQLVDGMYRLKLKKTSGSTTTEIANDFPGNKTLIRRYRNQRRRHHRQSQHQLKAKTVESDNDEQEQKEDEYLVPLLETLPRRPPTMSASMTSRHKRSYNNHPCKLVTMLVV